MLTANHVLSLAEGRRWAFAVRRGIRRDCAANVGDGGRARMLFLPKARGGYGVPRCSMDCWRGRRRGVATSHGFSTARCGALGTRIAYAPRNNTPTCANTRRRGDWRRACVYTALPVYGSSLYLPVVLSLYCLYLLLLCLFCR